MAPTTSDTGAAALDEKAQAAVEKAKAAGKEPFEKWAEKHTEIDSFFVAAARGAYRWAAGRELSESEFLDAIASAKGLKMHASMPPPPGWKPAERPARAPHAAKAPPTDAKK